VVFACRGWSGTSRVEYGSSQVGNLSFVSNILSHEEVACSKENPVASALSYVHLMSKCVSCNR
jgi:hypothetical protein